MGESAAAVAAAAAMRRVRGKRPRAALWRTDPTLDSVIRVDAAGELGADRIYRGQLAVLGGPGSGETGALIQHMWEQERGHRERFERLMAAGRGRPTVLAPLWHAAGWLVGAGTALLGPRAAMACTVAVETVIVDHYNEQLRALSARAPLHPPGQHGQHEQHEQLEHEQQVLQAIRQCRDEEQEHHDTGLAHGAEQAPLYPLLSAVIAAGCRAAIAISKRI